MMLRPLPVRHVPVLSHKLIAFVFAFAIVAGAIAPTHAARGKRPAGKAAGGKSAAHGGATKVGVATFLGPGEAASRTAVGKALASKKIVVVSAAELTATAKQLHVRLEDDAGFKAVAKTLKLTAIVTGEVSKKKATVTVRTGSDGSVVGEESFLGPDPKHLAGTVGKTFWKRLATAFNKTNPPGAGGAKDTTDEAPSTPAATAEAEPEPAKEPAKKEKPAPAREEVAAAAPERKPRAKAEDAEAGEGGDDSKAKAGDPEEGAGAPKKAKPRKSEAAEAPALPDEQVAGDLAIGMADMIRSLSYNQPRNDLSDLKVADYKLPQAPVLVAKGDFFPGAFLGSTGLLADVGLTGDLAYLLPVVTAPGMGGSYKTASLAWSLGPKVRLPAGFYGTVAYGDHWFKMVRTYASMPPTAVPMTEYKFVRVGAGIRRRLTTSLSTGANVAYDLCLGAPGQIGGQYYFPKATCAALEVGANIGYRVTNVIELRGGIEYQRFGLAFHVNAGDIPTGRAIAGGAVDEYTHIYLAVAFIIGGGDASAGGRAESAEPSDSKSSKPDKAASKDADGDEDDDEDDSAAK